MRSTEEELVGSGRGTREGRGYDPSTFYALIERS
jgi:hypothetical protein